MVFYNESQGAATDQNPFLHKCTTPSPYFMAVSTATAVVPRETIEVAEGKFKRDN